MWQAKAHQKAVEKYLCIDSCYALYSISDIMNNTNARAITLSSVIDR